MALTTTNQDCMWVWLILTTLHNSKHNSKHNKTRQQTQQWTKQTRQPQWQCATINNNKDKLFESEIHMDSHKDLKISKNMTWRIWSIAKLWVQGSIETSLLFFEGNAKQHERKSHYNTKTTNAMWHFWGRGVKPMNEWMSALWSTTNATNCFHCNQFQHSNIDIECWESFLLQPLNCVLSNEAPLRQRLLEEMVSWNYMSLDDWENHDSMWLTFGFFCCFATKLSSVLLRPCFFPVSNKRCA